MWHAGGLNAAFACPLAPLDNIPNDISAIYAVEETLFFSTFRLPRTLCSPSFAIEPPFRVVADSLWLFSQLACCFLGAIASCHWDEPALD